MRRMQIPMINRTAGQVRVPAGTLLTIGQELICGTFLVLEEGRSTITVRDLATKETFVFNTRDIIKHWKEQRARIVGPVTRQRAALMRRRHEI